jgi:amidase
MKSMRDIVWHNEKHPKAIPYGHDLLLGAEATRGDWSEPEYHFDRARDLRLTGAEGLDKVFRQHRLDALVVPMDHAAKFTGKAGYPALTVPCGYTESGIPVGLTFVGLAWSEGRLIGLAHAFERLATWRKAPLIY